MLHSIKPLGKLDIAKLDAITIQSAGLRRKDDGTYASTLYTDHDEFGMLGGYMRVLAARELYLQKPSCSFVFCNGISAKQIAKFGPDVPIEANVHAQEFMRAIAQDRRTKSVGSHTTPRILLEDKSVNTVTSIVGILAICSRENWKRVGLVSSDYHIPRMRALCDLVFKQMGKNPVEITFMSAESIMLQLQPGVYDEEIKTAYATASAKKRIRNEQNGLTDIDEGRYHLGEFQLAKYSK